jgi:hypothetical protein
VTWDPCRILRYAASVIGALNEASSFFALLTRLLTGKNYAADLAGRDQMKAQIRSSSRAAVSV